MGQLPDRPRGVRTHWKREASDPAAIGAELRTLMRLYPIHWHVYQIDNTVAAYCRRISAQGEATSL